MNKSQVLRTVGEIDIKEKNVLIRLDLDVPILDGEISDDSRLLMTLPTVKAVMAADPKKVTIIGHLGRPKKHSTFSLKPVREWFETKFPGAEIRIEENLRFNAGEEKNSQIFSKDIVRRSGAEVFVFEAFAAAHRQHASIVSLPKLVPVTAVGFRFAEEIRNLSKIWQNPKLPVVFVLGGAKVDTKLGLIPKLTEQADEVLVGGLLPTKIQISDFRFQIFSSKLKVARLRSDGLDITEESAKMFAGKIMSAGTVVWNGPMGAFEKSSHKSEIISHISESQYINTPAYGTYIVARAMRETAAFTVAGGGDTEAALTKLGGSEGIDWISSGGGAMLYYLAHRTLPFLEAVK